MHSHDNPCAPLPVLYGPIEEKASRILVEARFMLDETLDTHMVAWDLLFGAEIYVIGPVEKMVSHGMEITQATVETYRARGIVEFAKSDKEIPF